MSNSTEQESAGSFSSNDRGPASPPYHSASQTLPPYQSRTNLAGDDNVNSPDKGKQRSPPDSFGHEDTHRPEPRATMGPQGPRIALVDPLQGPHRDGAADEIPKLKFDAPFPGAAIRPPFSRRTSDASSVDDGDEEYFDEFDWSEDEQEQQNAREEEKQLQAIALRRRKISPFKIIQWLATTFLGNFIVSASLVVPAIVLQFEYRDKATPANQEHRDYVTDNVQAWFIWAAFNLHVEWWIHLFVELSPRLAQGIISLAWGNVSQSVLSFFEVFNAVKNYIKLVLYAALSWGSWAIIFNTIYGLYTRTNPETESRATYLYRIYQVIEFFFFFVLTICAEKMLIKIISIRFHKTAYSDRIARVTRALKVFDQLKDRRPKTQDKSGGNSPFGFRSTPRGRHSPGNAMGSRTIAPADLVAETDVSYNEKSSPSTKRGFFGKKKHATKRPSDQIEPAEGTPLRDVIDPSKTAGAATPRSTRSKRTIDATKAKASQATSLARRAMIDPTRLLTDETVGVGLDVNSPAEARRLARTLFRAYRGRHRRMYLVPEDFNIAFSTPQEAKEAFEVFDSDKNGDISMTEMRSTIVETYKERRFVAKSLEDTSSALGQLDLIFLVIAFIIIAFEAFAIFNVDVSKTLTTFYTLAIGASFVFRESAQEVFDSIIFLFVTHPFDTGDRICVDGQVLVVQKMSLLSCQFLLWDNTQLFINNALLSQMFITNYRRSGYQWECVSMQVAFNTPWSALDAVQADLIHWMQTEPERMFEPSTAIVPQTLDYARAISVTIGMTHRGNYQDWGARWFRRNCFFAAVCYYMRKHGVKYMNSTQPIIYWDPPSYETSEAHAQRPDENDAEQRTAEARNGRGDNVAADDQVGISRERRESATTVRDQRRPSVAVSAMSGDEDADLTRHANVAWDNEPVLNDDFSQASQAGLGQAHGAKAKTFMGFVPPTDEIEGSALRRRKARRRIDNLTMQGGDG